MATKKAVATALNAAIEGMDREVTMLDPKLILANKNSRFGLKKNRIEAMKDAIIRDGGVLEAVEVEPLDESELTANPGMEYLLNFGHYRLAGLLAANAEGRNFHIPAVVVEKMDPVARWKRQMSENLERENQTPIDKAIAIKQALDLGMTKMEIRNVFSTVGGRKGMKVQPASNSFINMTLSFLDLSKKVQTLIHEGEIGVADAYWLTKQSEADRDIAVEKAQARRLKELETEDEDENKFLDAEKKRVEAEEKAKKDSEALEVAKKALEDAQSKHTEIADKALALFKAKMAAKGDEKKELEAKNKVAEKEARESDMALDKLRKEVAKQQEKADKQKAEAEARKAKLEAAKAASKASKGKSSASNPAGKSKADAPLQVRKSAAVEDKERPNMGGVNLTPGAIKKVFNALALPGTPTKVQKIAKVVLQIIGGHMLEKDIIKSFAEITGEGKK